MLLNNNSFIATYANLKFNITDAIKTKIIIKYSCVDLDIVSMQIVN